MKVALGQISCVVGDSEANVQKMISFSQQAAEIGCQVILFPEMSDTGYLPSAIPAAANSADRAIKDLVEAARRHGIWILAGLSEKQGESLFNSIAVIAADGSLGARYRKNHLFRPAPVEEDKIFSAGEALVQAKIKDWFLGLSICYDLRFPELYRGYAMNGCNILVNCTAWPCVRVGHWETLIRARAIENQCYFLGVNRVGTDGGMEFCGRSSIVSPFGDVIAVGSADKEELVIGEVKLSEVEAYRAAIPILQDRRADLY